jgi:hypothetical protein
MVSVLASSVVDRGFEARSGQTNDYEIGICCFSAKHAALRRKSKGVCQDPNQFRCIGGKCIDKVYLCDGTINCPVQDDEHYELCGKLFFIFVIT